MKQGVGLAVGIMVGTLIAGGGGYWLGSKGATSHDAGGAVVPAGAATPAGAPDKKERKLLYYRNPMGLPDTSPTPKKDPMGMDYVAVFEGEEDGGSSSEPASANQVKISTEKVQKLGVKTEAAQLRTLDKIVRASGRIEPDERRLYAISR